MPCGKGLWQAVAAARLGLDVALVAAVADDRFGHEIVDYLRDEGVDTSFLKLIDDAHTPFTGVAWRVPATTEAPFGLSS